MDATTASRAGCPGGPPPPALLPVPTGVGAEGRDLIDDTRDALVGADGDDPLIAEIESLTPDDLAARVAGRGA